MNDFREAIVDHAEEPLVQQTLLHLLREYKRPYDKITELVKKEQLSQVRRGLYVPGPRLRVPGPGPFLIANHLYGPSYISLESALAWWGMIPERVFGVSSVTMKKSRRYNTPAGRFSYVHVPLPYYAFGIRSVSITKKQVVLMASPEKALCDKIVATSGIFLRSEKMTRAFLIDDLRIDEEELRKLNYKEIESWIVDAPKKTSLQMLVKTLDKL